MAEETKNSIAEEVVVSDVCVAETPAAVEKEAPPQPEPEAEKVGKPAVAEVEDEKVAESASFKEESNKVDDFIDPEKKALDELKELIKEALSKHEFTAPPPPPPSTAEEAKPIPEEKKEEEESKPEEKKEETCDAEVPPPAEPIKEEAPVEIKEESETTPPPAAAEPPVTVVEKSPEKLETPEEIKETIVHEVPPPPQVTDECPPAQEEEKTPPPPPPPPAAEDVKIWGVQLLEDEKTDVILLKFLRARDFKVKEAFTMLKSVITWRKEFKIDELIKEEGIGEGLEKFAFLHGVDKEGHPVCYNAFGEFQDKELYNKTFADGEKRAKFLKWRIQFLEKSIRNLDFSPDGICTILQVNDLKNSPGFIFFKKELRQATNQALQLLQDNYPEFAAKQVFINVPWWYVAYNRMISPFFTARTKSKFVFAGPSMTAETLLKYIAPEQVPVQYGGLSREGEHEFTIADPATETTIKPSAKYTIELPITKACTLVWEARVVGWDVSYGAEFVPSVEGGYTWIIQKSRKMGPTDDPISSCSFKIGEPGKVVLTFDNQTSKRKKLLYRSKTKPSD